MTHDGGKDKPAGSGGTILTRRDLLELAREDSLAYDSVVAARRLPKETEEEKKTRSEAIQESNRYAIARSRHAERRRDRDQGSARSAADYYRAHAPRPRGGQRPPPATSAPSL